MRLLALPIVLAFSLSGCAEAPPQEDSRPSAEASAGRVAAATAPETLEGVWRVVAIGGQVLAEHEMVTLHADAQEIWWEPRCLGFVRGYWLDGNMLEVGPRVTQAPASDSTPAPVCLIARPPRLPDISRMLELARHVQQSEEQGAQASLLISGEGGTITLVAE